MLLCRFFINRLIHEIVPTDREVVPWHSHLVSVLAAPQRDRNVCASPSNVSATLSIRFNNDKDNLHPTCKACQTVPKPHSKYCVFVTTTASAINTIKPRLFERTSHMTSAAHSVLDFLPPQPFHILLTNFPQNQ